MRYTFHAIVLLFSVVAGAGGLPQFKIGWTSPLTTLKNYPLNTVTKQDAYDHHGIPDQKITTPVGREAWVYRLGQDQGVRTYTIEFEDGVVVDVVYHDQGPYAGSRASKLQSGAK